MSELQKVHVTGYGDFTFATRTTSIRSRTDYGVPGQELQDFLRGYTEVQARSNTKRGWSVVRVDTWRTRQNLAVYGERSGLRYLHLLSPPNHAGERKLVVLEFHYQPLPEEAFRDLQNYAARLNSPSFAEKEHDDAERQQPHAPDGAPAGPAEAGGGRGIDLEEREGGPRAPGAQDGEPERAGDRQDQAGLERLLTGAAVLEN